jgi:hypothetical protein
MFVSLAGVEVGQGGGAMITVVGRFHKHMNMITF